MTPVTSSHPRTTRRAQGYGASLSWTTPSRTSRWEAIGLGALSRRPIARSRLPCLCWLQQPPPATSQTHTFKFHLDMFYRHARSARPPNVRTPAVLTVLTVFYSPTPRVIRPVKNSEDPTAHAPYQDYFAIGDRPRPASSAHPSHPSSSVHGADGRHLWLTSHLRRRLLSRGSVGSDAGPGAAILYDMHHQIRRSTALSTEQTSSSWFQYGAAAASSPVRGHMSSTHILSRPNSAPDACTSGYGTVDVHHPARIGQTRPDRARSRAIKQHVRPSS
ncbi:hypothetical protein CERSUDRAFT_93592 [Gelatoporia subvermispora B]|uniref:Uncharacterized protein n=1 Tax=Ceriporiopsis subvermispora (strain B) TaxID=914234 RepID=M2R0N6_CERS8|nr:hypothetical protein CERSUDRAFT_93592 [Gelatoporia subvermispora B]